MQLLKKQESINSTALLKLVQALKEKVSYELSPSAMWQNRLNQGLSLFMAMNGDVTGEQLN
jgi:hypothetical protein